VNLRLRRRHRWLIAGLAAALPVAVVASLASRRPGIVAGELPRDVMAGAGHSWHPLSDREVLMDGVIVQTRLLSDRLEPGRLAVELTPARDLREPDPLIYWSPDPVGPGGPLPATAFLLGSLAGTHSHLFALPTEAADRDGILVLYSLGHQRIGGTASLATQSLLKPAP